MFRSVALVSLVFQNAGCILSTKYSFRNRAEHYSETSVVVVAEVLKPVTCLILEFRDTNWSPVLLRKSIRFSFHNISMFVPSTLYVVQNIAQMHAIKGLSPAVYVTGAQLKVLTSALFSTIMLKRCLNLRQVFSFFPLMAGVALVQLDSTSVLVRTSTLQLDSLLCLLVAVTLSGFSGALLELSFKAKAESVWKKVSTYLFFQSLQHILLLLLM